MGILKILKVRNCEASNPIYSFILPYRLLRMRGFRIVIDVVIIIIIISIPYRPLCLFGIMQLMR